MTTEEFITNLFCRVDDQMRDVRKHADSTDALSDYPLTRHVLERR